MRKNYSSRDYALFLLGSRDRSEGEIRKKLATKKFSHTEIEETVAFLLERKFLNDQRFAENYVKQKQLERPQGKYLLQQKLRAKDVKEEIIAKVIEGMPDKDTEEALEHLASSWLKKHHQIEPNQIWGKLGAYLLRRGFDYDQVKSVLNQFKQEI